MKKKLTLAAVLLLTLALVFTGCSAPKVETPAPATTEATTEAPAAEQPAGTLADGTYFAMGDEFDANSGWKSTVLIEVKDGKVATVDWNGVSIKAGMTKKEASLAGKYPMVEKGGAKAPWHEQAAAVEAYFLANPDTKGMTLNAEGKTDAISGVSISIDDFYALADQALAAGPSAPGAYKDGAYHAESAEFSAQSGWKDTVDVTVVHGQIVSVYWSGVHKDGGDDKKTVSMNGQYGMLKGGAVAEWHEQAAAAEAFIIETQDPTAVVVNTDGKTDAISGVTMAVGEFLQLVQEALK